MCGQSLPIQPNLAVRVSNGGLFLSRGLGRHPDRVIDSYEIILIRTGCLAICEQETEYCLKKGDALILEPGLRHRGLADYPPDLSFYWVHFYLDPPARVADGHWLPIPKRISSHRPDVLFERFQSFLSQQEQDNADAFRLNLYLLHILCDLSDAEKQLPEQTAGPLARQADQYIKAHFHQKISTRTIARSIGCNEDYLGRVYRKAFHMTLSQSICNIRIRYACSLLLDSVHNIQEIACKSGFEDPGYFRRVFQKAKGMSPTQFRSRFSKIRINMI